MSTSSSSAPRPHEIDRDDRTLATSRVIDLSPDQVFEAFANPERLARWWGPSGFTNTFHEFDFRPGGHWRFVMHGPDGTDYANHSVFDEIARPERVVFRHLDPMHEFEMTITLEELDSKTRLRWRMLFATAEHCQHVKPFVIQANEQNLDRLEAELFHHTHRSHPNS